MANLIIISGAQAVGKMTVAESLKEKTGYQLMINHDSIEVSDKIFGRGTDAQKELNHLIRKNVFYLAIKHDINLIFTLVVAYDDESEWEYINSLKNMFEQTGGTFYFVELFADTKMRLERNITPHRLEEKASKNDIERSTNDLLKTMQKHRLFSNYDEYICDNHIKIDNTYLSPDETADEIIERFNLNNNKKR